MRCALPGSPNPCTHCHSPPPLQDYFSALPFEIAHRILLQLSDPLCLTRLCCASKLWSSRAANDELWEPLFLARWRRPQWRRSRTNGEVSTADRDGAVTESGSGQSTALPIADVGWKKLFEYRLSLEDRWSQGDYVEETYPLQNAFVISVHPDFVIASFPRHKAMLLSRTDWSCVQILQGHDGDVQRAHYDAESGTIVTGRLLRVRIIGDFILAVSSFRSAAVWNRVSGKLLYHFINVPRKFSDWDATSKWLLSLSSDGSINRWCLRTGLHDCVLVQSHGRAGSADVFEVDENKVAFLQGLGWRAVYLNFGHGIPFSSEF
ncbi:hypothetical protein DFJ73DRAFT_761421 [Zopfochytrium polystomum]|nr:hypothetical protein DFJ73DRAFT_761421 [Zopfochytrium polystomum]